jgi:hypothetical protein
MDAGQQRQEHGERDRDVERAEQTAEPPGGAMHQGECRGVAEGEHLTGGEVDEEPGDPRPVRVGGDERAEHQGQVEAGQPGQLGSDHHGGQHRGGGQPEQRPSGPVHVSGG